ncbi:hypothetical protein NKH71_03170 [Mesorhizobium sp. M0983]|uniref:hypothetical protein n=1 Tax=Mesorhizobium sp. M0983 TaxID=2957040 RepID=UPI0033351B32
MNDDQVAWLELREPRCVPERKGPFKQAALAATLREFMDARPQAFITVISFDCYGRPMLQDGPEALLMADGRSRGRANRHRKTAATAFADAFGSVAAGMFAALKALEAVGYLRDHSCAGKDGGAALKLGRDAIDAARKGGFA